MPDAIWLLLWTVAELPVYWLIGTREPSVRDAEHSLSEPRRTGFEDPVYKKNLQRLIERNRQFEEAKE